MRSPVSATAEPANSRQIAVARRIVFMESSLRFARSKRRADDGNCCIPADYSKTKSEASGPLPAGVVSRYVGGTSRCLRAGKQDMTRTEAIDRVRQHLNSGDFLAELDRRVAYQTESQNPERRDCLRAYLEEELQPAFSQLDFATRLIESPTGKSPYLLAEYRESSSLPTVLMYGHGDVVDGMAGEWRDDLNPWQTTK